MSLEQIEHLTSWKVLLSKETKPKQDVGLLITTPLQEKEIIIPLFETFSHLIVLQLSNQKLEGTHIEQIDGYDNGHDVHVVETASRYTVYNRYDTSDAFATVDKIEHRRTNQVTGMVLPSVTFWEISFNNPSDFSDSIIKMLELKYRNEPKWYNGEHRENFKWN